MKLSKHSKQRLRQRANIKSQRIQYNFFKNALLYGKTVKQIEDIDLLNWVKARIKYNCNIKIYKNWVFIYSRNAKQLYTMYELPQELKNKE